MAVSASAFRDAAAELVSDVPSALLDELRSIIGERAVLTSAADLDPGSHPDNLRAAVIVYPRSAGEIAAIIRACRVRGISVVPQGGRTGLVGGTISRPGQVILSFERMNAIERLDPIEHTAVVQAGTTLAALQAAALEHGLEPGIDLPARGSATIGGMASTNAGGIAAFRNGVMRHQILGIEAVLADGTVYSDLTRVVKHSAGFDLKHLFIGAEGTLGVITRVALKLLPAPRATASALFGLPSVQAALGLLRRARRSQAGELRAAEALWQSFIQLTAAAQGWSEPALPLDSPIYLLLSFGGPDEAALRDELERLFGEIAEAFPETTGILPSSGQQERAVWRLREDTDQLYRRHAGAPSYDVSVPLSEMEGYVARIQDGLAALGQGLSPYIFGHIADGNLHIVLNRPGLLPEELASEVEAILYRDLPALGGSFSAEHGVGSKRIHTLLATADPTKLALMERIKAVLDGCTLLNPGKVLPLAASSATRGPAGP